MTLVCRDLDLDPKRYPPRAVADAVSNLKNELVDHETTPRERADNDLERSARRGVRRCTSAACARPTRSTSTT